MRYLIEFQYKPFISASSDNDQQDKVVSFENTETALIPNVGDNVIYQYGGEKRTFKVVSRNFSYGAVGNVEKVEDCTVTIVVTDIADLQLRGGRYEDSTAMSDTNN